MVDGSIFADFEHPICATAAMAGAAGIDIAILNDPHTG
jgi:IMP cyclohydrolase